MIEADDPNPTMFLWLCFQVCISQRSPLPLLPPPPHAHTPQAKDVKKATCLNLAAAALKQQQWGEAVTQASRVLDMEPGNIKALYR